MALWRDSVVEIVLEVQNKLVVHEWENDVLALLKVVDDVVGGVAVFRALEAENEVVGSEGEGLWQGAADVWREGYICGEEDTEVVAEFDGVRGAADGVAIGMGLYLEKGVELKEGELDNLAVVHLLDFEWLEGEGLRELLEVVVVAIFEELEGFLLKVVVFLDRVVEAAVADIGEPVELLDEVGPEDGCGRGADNFGSEGLDSDEVV